MSKVFEIRKAGFLNKGAAMMLIAAAQEVRARLSDAIVTVAPDYTMPFQPRADHGLWQRPEVMRFGVDLGRVVSVLPRNWRRRYGFITEGEIDIVLDAAGFGYSDQWGGWLINDLDKRSNRWKRQGKKLILLPQAFGPFDNSEAKSAMARIADRADLIFARDATSFKHLTGAVGERPNIQQAPDFTNLLSPADPGDLLSGFDRPVAIVPNARMLDKTSETEAAGYVEKMRQIVHELQEADLDPFLLVHEGAQDKAIGDRINEELPRPMQVIWPEDPLVAKGVIQQCEGVVASRFHALVSALAQGVPALGTSWSHKYGELFSDYGCPQCLMSDDEPSTVDPAQLRTLTDPLNRADMAAQLKERSRHLKGESRAMWEQVFSVVA